MHWIDSPELMALWAGGTFEWPLTTTQLRDYLHDSRSRRSLMRVYRVVDAAYESARSGRSVKLRGGSR